MFIISCADVFFCGTSSTVSILIIKTVEQTMRIDQGLHCLLQIQVVKWNRSKLRTSMARK